MSWVEDKTRLFRKSTADVDVDVCPVLAAVDGKHVTDDVLTIFQPVRDFLAVYNKENRSRAPCLGAGAAEISCNETKRDLDAECPGFIAQHGKPLSRGAAKLKQRGFTQVLDKHDAFRVRWQLLEERGLKWLTAGVLGFRRFRSA